MCFQTTSVDAMNTVRYMLQYRRQRRRRHCKHRRTYKVKAYSERVRRWSARQFRTRYRLDLPTFVALVADMKKAGLGAYKGKGRRSQHTAEARVSMMLRYLAGAHICDIADAHDLYDDTVYSIVKDAMQCLCRAKPLPKIFDPAEMKRCATSFGGRAASDQFAGVIGALDGVYIRIVPPAQNASQYVSRKGGFSLNMQAICDANARFTWFSIHSPGGAHDALAFRLSNLCRALEAGSMPPQYFLVGDAAYSGQADQILTPYSVYKGSLPIEEDAFNFYQSSNRVVIERAFGLLVGRQVEQASGTYALH